MTRKAKVALIAPRIITARDQVKRAQPPLGLACLAAVLEERGHEIVMIDSSAEGYENVAPVHDGTELISYGLPDRVVAERIAALSPDLIGISALFSSQAQCAIELARSIKEVVPKAPIVFGGIHASMLSLELMEEEASIDFIMAGESDYTFTHFVEKFVAKEAFLNIPGLVWRRNSGVCKNGHSEFVSDLDILPYPAWHLLDMEKYFEIGMPHNPFVKSNRVGCIMTSRGCPERCYFCSSSRYFGHRFRSMSASRVIGLIKHLVDEFSIREIQIEDDTFTLNYKRVIEICEGIEDLGLRITLPNGTRADVPKGHGERYQMFQSMNRAGCEQISISVEHGDQKFLDNVIGKRLNLAEAGVTCRLAHKAGLLVHANFMVGFPFETDAHRKRTAEFARKLDADSFSVSLVSPLPGTALWDLVKQHDLFMEDFDVNKILYSRVSIKPHDISAENLLGFVEELNRELNVAAQKRRPAVCEKYKLFKGKNSSGDRKYQHVVDGSELGGIED